MVKNESIGRKDKAGIRMAQPFDHPKHHLPTGDAVLGEALVLPATNTWVPAFPPLGCTQVVRKIKKKKKRKKMINKDKWRRAEHAGNPSPSFLFFPKQIKL